MVHSLWGMVIHAPRKKGEQIAAFQAISAHVAAQMKAKELAVEVE